MKDPKILIVDDEEMNVKLAKAMLSTEQYHALGVLSGEEALKVVSQFQPDLILLDVMMPGIDGYEVCRRLKGDENAKMIPILMVTALSDREHRLRAMEAGADDFLSKPVDKMELLIRVKSLLRIKQYHDELFSTCAELADKNNQLQDVEKAKEGLIHMIIHDLKNPLTAVHSVIEMLIRDERQFEKDQLIFMKRALDSCGEMNEQIESLLTIHKMENAKLTLQRTSVDLDAMVGAVIGRFQLRAEAKGIFLSRAALDQLPPAEIDRELMERVVANLLGNAIRHAPAGSGVTVQLGSHSANGSLWVRVKDSGEGIAPEYLDRVFDKFEQVKLKREGITIGSSGLGLAFCKMVVEAHGGRIWAESEGAGKGSTFAFELPLSGHEAASRA
jgi:two-component system sensor histidine kinase/response regulator